MRDWKNFLRVAVNWEYVSLDEAVHANDEIAIIPQGVHDPACGTVALFIGTTRNHSNGKSILSLVYDAYIPMALKIMNRIAVDIRTKWGVQKLSIVHRIGRLEIGEASVVIAVSSVHTLKSEVPIWKKEY